IRIDSSEYFLGVRLNMFVAISLTVIGVVWFVLAQLRPEQPAAVLPPGAPEAAGAAEATPDEATEAAVTSPAEADQAAEAEQTDEATGTTPRSGD
ncbi:MAG TPA: hypothetical protein VGD91_20155, partial [Trebonia sp.]